MVLWFDAMRQTLGANIIGVLVESRVRWERDIEVEPRRGPPLPLLARI